MPLCLKRSQLRLIILPLVFMFFMYYFLHSKQKRLVPLFEESENQNRLNYEEITLNKQELNFKNYIENIYDKIEFTEEKENEFIKEETEAQQEEKGILKQQQHDEEEKMVKQQQYERDEGEIRQHQQQKKEEERVKQQRKKDDAEEKLRQQNQGEEEEKARLQHLKDEKEEKLKQQQHQDKQAETTQQQQSVEIIEKLEAEQYTEDNKNNSNEEKHEENDPKETMPKIHEVAMEEPYRTRLINISERCRTLNHSSRPLSKSSLKYHDDIKVVMCEVPKIASTTWQILLLRLGGFKGETQFRKFGYKEIYLKTFRNLANETIAISKMQSYLSFFLTRHPFERLVSAYSDKLTNRSKATWYRETLGRKIAKKEAERYLTEINSTLTIADLTSENMENLTAFQIHSDAEKLKILKFADMLKTGEVSFLHFIRHVIDEYHNGLKEQMDGHWIPQTDLCMPCDYQYSYVIRFDNVVPESQRLLDYIQAHTNFTQNKINFPKDRPSVIKDQATQLAFSSIDKSYVDILRELYSDDFFLLDHNPFLYQGQKNA